MTFPFYLAVRNLLRYPARNLLYVLGISITAALLLDMILLSGGLTLSLQRVLKELGYEVRISPRGTLPFETSAQILNFRTIQNQMRQLPSVEAVDAMLGASIAVESAKQSFPCFALGIQQQRPSLYRIIEGQEPREGAQEVLVNHYLAREKKIRAGDKLLLWIPNQSETIGAPEKIEVTVSGTAFFPLDADGQFTVSAPLILLQRLMAQEDQDPVSVIMIRLRNSSLAQQTVNSIHQRFPQLSAYTIEAVVQIVDKQLSYFRQFSYILGGISLVVTFVLIFIITTISFHDRLGEIALLKAIGLSRKTLFITIILEGVLTSLASTVFGFLLGKAVALYLDAILTSAPGLPEDFSFFLFQPNALLKAAITLLLTGFFAGIYPASAAASLPVAQTLREEIL